MKTTLKDRNLLRTQAYIDGRWVDAVKRKTFSVLNPFDEKEIAKVPDMGEAEAVEAIEAAYFALPVWRALTARERSLKLKGVAELIKKHANDLALLLTLEQGKPLSEAESEIQDTADAIIWSAEAATRIQGTTQSSPDGTCDVMTIRQPIGVVAIISPWNFPFFIPAMKGFAALAAGCTVVIKPAEDTPLTALALAYLSHEAGIPQGVFNVVTCKNPQKVGEVLTSHPLVAKVTFTGSTEVGKRLLAQAAPSIKKVTLELGGNCPLIVFEDADQEKALQGIFDLKFYNAGQCCNTINRILVHESIYESFIDRFIEMTKSFKCRNGLESPNIGPLINQESMKKIKELLADAAEHGAEVIGLKKKGKGLICPPVIVKNVHSGMRIFNEEIFGPVAVFASFSSDDEAIAVANDTRYGLAAYFYTENLNRSMQVAKELEAGTVGVNTTNVYSVTLPFGGWKESGLGREGGINDLLNDFCELKAISIGYS